MKKMLATLIAALTVLALAACGSGGWDEVTTAVPANRPSGGTTAVVPRDTTAIEIDTTAPRNDTTAPDTSAEPGSLTGAWEGTYVNGDCKIVITRTHEAGNYITIKLSGASLPNLTIGHELTANVSSFTDSEGFGVAFSKNGDVISVSATAEKLAGYTGDYRKQ